MDLEKLKEYIQQELDSLKTNKKELGKAKTQLTLLKKELDDLYINSNLESFSELFKQFNFNMSFGKKPKRPKPVSIFNWAYKGT